MARFDKLESRFEEIDRRRTNLLASKATYAQQACYDSRREIRTRPLPDPPPQPGWRYTQPLYRQPQHQKRDRYLSPPPYQPDRQRPHHLHQSHYQLPKYHQPFGGPSPAYSEFPRRQIRQSQHVPGRQPSFWDPPGARVPINSLSYAESTSLYNPNCDCDSDGYDEGFDVGYSRQPYHQQHSVPHLRQDAACLEQPAAQQQPLLQLPPSCRHPSSGTLDEETCFMDDKIDYLSDNEKGVGHGSITATGPAPPPQTTISPPCSPAVAAVPSSNQPPTVPSCIPDDDSGEESGLLDERPPPAVISPPCCPYISGEEETLLDDDEEVDSIEEVKKVVASLDAARMTSNDVVENCLSKDCGAYRCALVGNKVAPSFPIRLKEIVFICGNLHVRDPTRLNPRSTSLDTDARLIPPRNDTPCLSILGSMDELFVLGWNFADYMGSPLLIFDGGDEGKRLVVRYVFDPGEDASPKHIFAKTVIVSWFPP